MKKTDWLVVLAVAFSAIALVACGGDSDSDGGESASGEEEAALEFTQCLRAHGVEVDDPEPGQKNIELGDAKDPAAKEALAACNGKLDGVGQELSSSEEEEFREGALALAQCFRDEGIDMGDPKILGSGKFLLDIAGVDTESPAFEAAQEACDDKLPELSGITVGG